VSTASVHISALHVVANYKRKMQNTLTYGANLLVTSGHF